MNNPTPTRKAGRAVFGFTLFLISVPVLLFVSAGTATWPMAWIYVVLFLANTAGTEAAANPELTQAKQIIKRLRSDLNATGEHLADAKARANAAEQRFAAAGDLVLQLFAQEKRQRILAAAERWPQLPTSSVAIVAGASPSYASEVLKSRDGR